MDSSFLKALKWGKAFQVSLLKAGNSCVEPERSTGIRSRWGGCCPRKAVVWGVRTQGGGNGGRSSGMMTWHKEVEPKQDEQSVHARGWVLHGVLETKWVNRAFFPMENHFTNYQMHNNIFVYFQALIIFLFRVTFSTTGNCDFPGGSEGKASAYNAGDLGSIQVGKISWRRKWQPTPVFLPGKSHGQRNLVGYSPRDHRVGHDLATRPPPPPLVTVTLETFSLLGF